MRPAMMKIVKSHMMRCRALGGDLALSGSGSPFELSSINKVGLDSSTDSGAFWAEGGSVENVNVLQNFDQGADGLGLALTRNE
jgi:hypothetical protein